MTLILLYITSMADLRRGHRHIYILYYGKNGDRCSARKIMQFGRWINIHIFYSLEAGNCVSNSSLMNKIQRQTIQQEKLVQMLRNNL